MFYMMLPFTNDAMTSLVVLCFFVVSVVALFQYLWRRNRKQNRVASVTSKTSSTFQTPLPHPREDFNLEDVKPQLYRPFRHGPNYITMGQRKLQWDDWIEMDSNFMWFHDAKVKELEEDFDGHVKYVDNAITRDACFEVFEELARYLTHRYPSIFHLHGHFLRNLATGEEFKYPAVSPDQALASAAKLVQDDLVIMVENDDAQYHIDAGAVCLPGFWRLREKFRMSLDELHFAAKVPHYEAKLQKSMNRFFKALTPEKPVQRNNFFIQLDDGLSWSPRMGDRQSLQEASWATANSEGLTIDELHFRSERQTLRRLPRSKAILFTIRTYFEPITEIAKEPHIPGRLAEAIREWDETVSTYKGKSKWEGILLPYLDQQHAKQVESGILNEESERAYPF